VRGDALTYAAVWVIALAAWQAGRPELIRSQRLVLAHVWEGVELETPSSISVSPSPGKPLGRPVAEKNQCDERTTNPDQYGWPPYIHAS
jgi:hypothetical protein